MAIHTLTTLNIEQLITGGESLTVEFKGEAKGKLPDREIYETVVCMANADDGGIILLGVEDDGSVTGAFPRHGTFTDPVRLRTMIFNRTMPRLDTDISVHEIAGNDVVVIQVPSYAHDVCATAEGRSLRRRMAAHGPECSPFYPHEHVGRLIDLGRVDYSRQLIPWAGWDDLDPLEFERLRKVVKTYNGDQSLLSLDDQELAKALQLVESHDEQLVPNVSGLLLLGREESLKRAVPSARAAFQVIDETSNILVNLHSTFPLLKVLETIEERFSARVTEREVSVQLFRVPIPEYDLEGFREALNNAFLHRDYSVLGSVYVQLHADHILITNPGGFLEGIRLDNLLIHEPKPRNQRLAEVFRRLGLVETTGRGIDRIFYGQLRYGRPMPDFGRSDSDTVRVELRGGDGDPEFTRFVVEETRAGQPPSVWDLVALSVLLENPSASATAIGEATQRGERFASELLDQLARRRWVEVQGRRPNREYRLSASFHRFLRDPSERVHARRADPDQQQSMVLEYVETYGRITRSEAMELCGVSDRQASHLLRRLTDLGLLRKVGERRWTYYERDAQ